MVAIANGISRSAAYVLVKTRQMEYKKRGGLREKSVKVIPQMMIYLEDALEHDPTITLEIMRLLIVGEYGIELSLSTISRHLIGLTYSMKKLRLERNAMNNLANKIERREFAIKLGTYRAESHVILYCDETNYNVYISRTVGRAKEGERAIVSVPISQDQNLQIQCAVANGVGVMEVNYLQGKIDMDTNASFLLDTFISAMKWTDDQPTCRGKKIILVLGNVPAHERSEGLLEERLLECVPVLPAEHLVTLRLTPNSPMCNPIEGCFSVLKSAVKNYIAANRERLRFHDGGYIEKQKLALREEAAKKTMERISSAIVVSQESTA
jgi:transposase